MSSISQPEARIRIERVLHRSGKKAGHPQTPTAKVSLPELNLRLPPSNDQRVEQLVIAHLRQQGLTAYHVENRLFTGLFALLFWPALYAPVKGAFFHPFQSGPADLYHPEFADRRRSLLEAGFAQLDDGRYIDTIFERLAQKQDVRCSLIHWPTLQDPVRQTLDAISATQLAAIFRHLLLDLRHHRRGLPDLICFDPDATSFQLIEVKGPGDRLQDHQRLWLEFFIAQNIPATLCHVRFEESS